MEKEELIQRYGFGESIAEYFVKIDLENKGIYSDYRRGLMEMGLSITEFNQAINALDDLWGGRLKW